MPNRAPRERVLEADLLTQDFGVPLVQRLSIVRCQAAARVTWHSHPFYEILLLSEGATAYEFRDGATAELSGGQFLIIPPNIVHRGLNELRKPGSLSGVMIAPQMSNATLHTPFSFTDLVWMQQSLDRAAYTPLKMSPQLKSLIKSLPVEIAAFNPSSPACILRIRLVVCQIVFEVVTHLTGSSAVIPATVVDHAIRFMHENLDSPTSIDKIAKTVGCSRARLFEVFKETTGLTPNDYWQRVRVERAYQQLLTTRDSISKIAEDCGFATSQYFCTVFRKYWGISPRDCRKGAKPIEPKEPGQLE